MLVDFTGLSTEAEMTVLIPVYSSTGVLPTWVWIAGFDSFD
ncbi:MAG: hypothetical protein QF535_17190 [Anaerolineales bacterium]|nr:hypothetical protein [Anaerolineales bacterium]